jgi:hypothetical protein
MIVYVDEVRVEAWSSIGYGYGYNDSGEYIQFAGDHRPMRGLGEALRRSREPIEAEIEDWQIIRVRESCKPSEGQGADKLHRERQEARS